MNKSCPNCQAKVKGYLSFAFGFKFQCEKCKTLLMFHYHKKLSYLVAFANLFIGIFLGYYKFQNVPLFISMNVVFVALNLAWYYDCSVQISNEPSGIISYIKEISLSEWILLVSVIFFIGFKHISTTNRIPAGYPDNMNGKYDYVNPPIDKVEYP